MQNKFSFSMQQKFAVGDVINKIKRGADTKDKETYEGMIQHLLHARLDYMEAVSVVNYLIEHKEEL